MVLLWPQRRATNSDMGALNKCRCFMVIRQYQSPEDVVHGPYHCKGCDGSVGAVAIWAGSIEKHGLVHFLCLFSPACFGVKVQERVVRNAPAPAGKERNFDVPPSNQPMWIAQEHDGMCTETIIKGPNICFDMRKQANSKESTARLNLLLLIKHGKAGSFQGQPLLSHVRFGSRCCSKKVWSARLSTCRKECGVDVLIWDQIVLHTRHTV